MDSGLEVNREISQGLQTSPHDVYNYEEGYEEGSEDDIERILEENEEDNDEVILSFKVEELQKMCCSLTETNQKLQLRIHDLEQEESDNE